MSNIETTVTSQQKKLEPLVYTVPEIANLLRINVPRAYEMAKIKDFPAIKIGKRIVIPKQAFLEWTNKVAPGNEYCNDF